MLNEEWSLFVRMIVLGELSLLMFGFSFCLGAVKPLIPQHLYMAGASFMFTLAVFAIAIVINMALRAQAAPGTVVVAVLLVPACAVVAWACTKSVAHRYRLLILSQKEVGP